MSRTLWNELSSKWPPTPNTIVGTGWDFWLRIEFFQNRWLTIIPCLSRVIHVNSGPASVNVNVQQQIIHFQNIIYAKNDSNVIWNDVIKAEMNIKKRLKRTKQLVEKHEREKCIKVITTKNEIMKSKSENDNMLFIWPFWRGNYSKIAKELSLWPSPRGFFQNHLLITYFNRTIILFDEHRTYPSFLSSYSYAKSCNFNQTTVIANRNESCHGACDRLHGMKCCGCGLDQLNDCNVLRKYFKCKGCAYETGADLPAAVENDAVGLKTNGWCLITEDVSHVKCHGQFLWTRRLCSCMKIGIHSNVNKVTTPVSIQIPSSSMSIRSTPSLTPTITPSATSTSSCLDLITPTISNNSTIEMIHDEL